MRALGGLMFALVMSLWAAPASASILSVYWGVDDGIAPVVQGCTPGSTAGLDGVPVVFSRPFDPAVDLSNPQQRFEVKNSAGAIGDIVCATLAPATGPEENRTILLIGQFAAAGQTLQSVKVIGDLPFADGTSATSDEATGTFALSPGTPLVLAESFAASAFSGARCPAAAQWAILATFAGGARPTVNTSPGAFTVQTSAGPVPTLALREVDLDNHIVLCLGALASGASFLSLSVQAGAFQDPSNTGNLASTVDVLPGPAYLD